MMIAARRGKVICALLNRRRIATTSHESPFDYRKGEHLSMDPVGPVKVPAPLMVYGDKSTGHISVQLYKSELLSPIP
jgi:hypothetical protein